MNQRKRFKNKISVRRHNFDRLLKRYFLFVQWDLASRLSNAFEISVFAQEGEE